jgi:hypothetical protein
MTKKNKHQWRRLGLNCQGAIPSVLILMAKVTPFIELTTIISLFFVSLHQTNNKIIINMGPYIAILCFIIGGLLGFFMFKGVWDDRKRNNQR